jgi:Big-like domain-containing protein
MRRFTSPALLIVTLALLFSPAAPAAGPLRHNADGTVSDLGTGLTWVADRSFAVTSGFARDVVLPRAAALQLVAAMNAGRVENFGRTEWRLPTQRELLRMAALTGGLPRPFAGGSTPLAGARGVGPVWPVIGASVLAGFEEVAILGTNSVMLSRNTNLQGNVAVNDASPGPTLRAGFELAVDRASTVNGSLKADSIAIDRDSHVGDVYYNSLQNNAASTGTLHTPLALPVFALLPQFHTAALRPEAEDVFVAPGQTVTLPAGDYDDIEIAPTGTLVLSGGLYNARSLRAVAGTTACITPCRSVTFSAATDLRIAERLDVGTFAYVGPAVGSGISASEVILYVGGIDGTDGLLGSLPRAAAIGRGSTVAANLYVPNGTIHVDRDGSATGVLIGRDVLLSQHVAMTLDSYFANNAPVADPQSVFTNGAATLAITLTGSDPDGDDITFAIVTGPTQGSLDTIDQDPPPTPTPRPSTAGLRAATAAVASSESATVNYTPFTADNVEDSFTFKVTDTFGAVGMATVLINPADPPENPPPPATTVVAFDGAEQTTTDRPVTITLHGDAPSGVSLTFSLVAGSGPANASLGSLVQGSESPQRTASIVYTPADDFNGTDGFDFTACGEISGSPVCDTAHVTISVAPATVEPSELAPDQTATTPQDTPVQITLGTTVGSAPSGLTSAAQSLVFTAQPAAFLDGAEIAGNVADATGDGFGDEHNALPGGSPVFASASVGFTGGGAGSNGTARFHVEWDISGLGTGLDSAEAILHTHRGTIDSLDTFFFTGAGGNGTLEDSDFEATMEQVTGVVMPVPPLEDMPVGSDGTFTFDVKGQLEAAIASGASFFSVQGRVNEALTGPARGLEVRTTADGNLASFLEPQLSITTPGVTPATVYTINSLPSNGILKNSLGATITSVPTVLPDSRVSYTPNTSFTGTESFAYQAELNEVTDTGVVTIHVITGDCALDPSFCDDGR